ncbi:MAG: hypothetical protein IJL87_08510 [Clostridia bacterium]|nr:hypothetical protein [Clostridia bacterium]
MRKSKQMLDRFQTQMGLSSKKEKKLFWIAFLLLVFYVEFVVYGQNYVLGMKEKALVLLNALLVVPACFLIVYYCGKIKNIPLAVKKLSGQDKKYTALIFCGVFAVTFLIYFLWMRVYWPGPFSQDSLDQYAQAISGSYNNWHPVIHTWLFFSLPYSIFKTPAAIGCMQIMWFSLAITYLLFVLYKNGCPKLFLVFSWLYITANPTNTNVMLFPWKDSALAIFAIVLFAQIIEIYVSRGKWLEKTSNLVAFSVISFLALGMRHNAVLLIAPIFVILYCLFKTLRKKVLISAASVALATVVFLGPVLSIAGVQRPDKRLLEVAGFPLTVLSDVYVKDRSSLSGDAQEFMDSLASPEQWEHYMPGNFNSIKWDIFFGDLGKQVDDEGAVNILKYTVQAAIKRPRYVFEAFLGLTHTLWRFDGLNNWNYRYELTNNDYGLTYQGNRKLRTIAEKYTEMSDGYFTKYLFNYLGVIILVMLFMAVSRMGRGNWPKVLIVLAPFVYNLGTMLLLSTPYDTRFFHFNYLIVIPILYIILVKLPPRETEEY